MVFTLKQNIFNLYFDTFLKIYFIKQNLTKTNITLQVINELKNTFKSL